MPISFRKICLGAGLAAIVLAGCATTPPPTGDLVAGERLLERARLGAVDGAGRSEVERATQWLRDAQALMAARKYDDAMLLSRRAATAAELALARQRLSRVDAGVESMQADIRRLEREVSLLGESR